MSKIFVCGDTHRDHDIFKLDYFAMKNSDLTRDDYMIITGDFGGIWYGDERDDYILNEIYGRYPWTTLFVDGNHSNHDAIDKYPVNMWMGGKVHFIRPYIIHLMRGQVYNINGNTIFTMGGADSIDKEWRKEGESWWVREMPSLEEYKEAEANLSKYHYNVDYIITHCCSNRWVDILSTMHPIHDKLTNFFEVLEDDVNFKHWYFGHHHGDLPLDEKHSLLYQKIVELGEAVPHPRKVETVTIPDDWSLD